jgi:Glycogen recognition site of AMP-activated protein kinase
MIINPYTGVKSRDKSLVNAFSTGDSVFVKKTENNGSNSNDVNSSPPEYSDGESKLKVDDAVDVTSADYDEYAIAHFYWHMPANVVKIIGSWDHWLEPKLLLKDDALGCHHLATYTKTGRHEYKYLVDDAVMINLGEEIVEGDDGSHNVIVVE